MISISENRTDCVQQPTRFVIAKEPWATAAIQLEFQMGFLIAPAELENHGEIKLSIFDKFFIDEEEAPFIDYR